MEDSRFLGKEDLEFELKIILDLTESLLELTKYDKKLHKRYVEEKARLINVYSKSIMAKCGDEYNEE